MNPPEATGRVRSRTDGDERDVGHPANRLDAALKQLRIAGEEVDDAEVEACIEAARREAEGAAERLDSADE